MNTQFETISRAPENLEAQPSIAFPAREKIIEIIKPDLTAEGMRANILEGLEKIFKKLDVLSSEETEGTHLYKQVRLGDLLFTYNPKEGEIVVEQYTKGDAKVWRKSLHLGQERHLHHSIVEVNDGLTPGSFHLVEKNGNYGVKENKISKEDAFQRLILCMENISSMVDRASQ